MAHWQPALKPVHVGTIEASNGRLIRLAVSFGQPDAVAEICVTQKGKTIAHRAFDPKHYYIVAGISETDAAPPRTTVRLTNVTEKPKGEDVLLEGISPAEFEHIAGMARLRIHTQRLSEIHPSTIG